MSLQWFLIHPFKRDKQAKSKGVGKEERRIMKNGRNQLCLALDPLKKSKK
jgi:hypothetical protein